MRTSWSRWATADSDNVTGRVIEALSSLDLTGVEVEIIDGGANPHGAAIEAACSSVPNVHASAIPVPVWRT